MVSYAFQVILSILFGPVLSLNTFFCSRFSINGRYTKVAAWLATHQELSISTQLWFTMGTSLACFVQQLRGGGAVYETTMIAWVLAITFLSFTATLSAFYQPIKPLRWISLAPLVGSSMIMAVFSVRRHLEQVQQLGRILSACQRVNHGAILPSPLLHRRYCPVVGAAALIPPFLISWLFLRVKRGTEATATRSVAERLVVPVVMTISVTMSGLATWLVFIMIRTRQGMNQISKNGTRENEWGVGQVSAVCAWSPLLMEMVISAASAAILPLMKTTPNDIWSRRWLRYRFSDDSVRKPQSSSV